MFAANQQTNNPRWWPEYNSSASGPGAWIEYFDFGLKNQSSGRKTEVEACWSATYCATRAHYYYYYCLKLLLRWKVIASLLANILLLQHASWPAFAHLDCFADQLLVLSIKATLQWQWQQQLQPTAISISSTRWCAWWWSSLQLATATA